MRCSLCEGAKRVVAKGEAEPIPCPRCEGEGELPTSSQIVKAVAEGRAELCDPWFLGWVKEVRRVLVELRKTWSN